MLFHVRWWERQTLCGERQIDGQMRENQNKGEAGGGTRKTEDGTNWFSAAEMPAIVMEKTDSQIDVCGKNHSKHFNRILIPYWKCLWAFVAASSRSGCVLSQKNTNKETNKVFWVHKVKKNDDAPAAQFFICFMRAWQPPKPNNFFRCFIFNSV